MSKEEARAGGRLAERIGLDPGFVEQVGRRLAIMTPEQREESLNRILSPPTQLERQASRMVADLTPRADSPGALAAHARRACKARIA